MMDLWSSGELSEEKPLNRICKVEGCWYGVRDVRCLTKSGVHSYGSVTNGCIDPSCRVMKSQVLGRYRLAGVGSSDRSCRSGSYRVAWLCAAAVNPDHWHVLIFCLMN
ncbi:unnamed protein product [Brassica oleracea]